MKNKVVFVIVAYHPNRNLLRKLQFGLGSNIFITVDNGLASNCCITGAKIVSNESNLGYGGGANVGIKWALSQEAQWIVVTNQDVVVNNKSIESFVNKLKKSPPGVVGPFMGSLDPKRWTTLLNSMSNSTKYISGSFIAIHRDVIRDVGNFFEPYFMYYEDVDLCVRALNKGFDIVNIPVSGITHCESLSLGSGSLIHEYYLARNHLLFIQRCAPLSAMVYEIVRLPKTLIEYMKQHNLGGYLGIRDFILHKFGKYKGKS